MKKWLGIAAALLLVLLILMWRSVNDSAATPPASPRVDEASTSSQGATVKTATAGAKPAVAEADADDKPAVDEKPKKLDPMSDEFFFKFIEQVPKRLTADAAECYEGKSGSLHRNQKMVLAFNVSIKNGAVTVRDLKVKPQDPDEPNQKMNTLNDPALESCFIQKVARAGWHDDTFPDYEWPDELVLRPERGMKGYQKSNREYVGAEAPRRDPKAHLALKPEPVPQ